MYVFSFSYFLDVLDFEIEYKLDFVFDFLWMFCCSLCLVMIVCILGDGEVVGVDGGVSSVVFFKN